MFGQSNTGGGLFGQSAGAGTSTSLFGGGAGSTPGGFGSTGGSSLFGGGGGSAFGGTTTQNTGGGSSLFGNQPQSGFPSSTGGSAFGLGPSSTMTGGSNPFGGTSTGSGGSSLFVTSQPQGSLFGNQPQSSMFGTQNQPTTSGFGSTGGTGLFGGAGSAFGTGTALGGTSTFSQPTTGMMGFGSSGFGTNQSFGMQAQQQQQQRQPDRIDPQSKHVLEVESNPQFPWWYRELVRIQAAYRVCQFSRFQQMMYEVSPRAPDIYGQSSSQALIEETKQIRRRQIKEQIPWIESSMSEWRTFDEKNPDPENWIPCPVIGIDALKARVEAQTKNIEAQLKAVEKDKNQDWLDNAAAEIRQLDEQIQSCRRKHAMVTHRLVGVLGRLERLQARYVAAKGPRRPTETEFHESLKKLRKALDDPKGCKAKLLQITAKLAEIRALDQQMSSSDSLLQHSGEPSNSEKGIEQKKADEEEEAKMKRLMAFLEEQQQSMNTVIAIMKRDARDINFMRDRLSG